MPRPAYGHLIVGSILLLVGTLRAAPVSTQPSEHDAQMKLAVRASNAFAFDLYARLAASRENAGKNLFFSPYSISIALTMAAEGARGETAEQMGRVLHFPTASHRDAGDDQAAPWDMSLLRVGIAALAEQLRSDSDRPEAKEMRKKIDALRKELDEAEVKVRMVVDGEPVDKVAALEALERTERIPRQLNALLRRADAYELNVSNALWVEKTFPLRKSYVDTVNRFYGGGIFSVDFLRDPERAGRQIDAWIEQLTHSGVREIVSPEILAKKERIGMVLTNAVYFRGRWLEPFSVSDTKDEAFAIADKAKVRVAMMHQRSMKLVRYAAFNGDGSFFATPEMIPAEADPKTAPGLYPGRDGFAMVELPYKGGCLSMIAIAPMDATGIESMGRNVTAKQFDKWTSRLVGRETDVFLPKFKLQVAYEMRGTLKTLGIERAFNDPRKPNGAQFDGMRAIDDPRAKLYVSDATHRASIDVNEEGTVAIGALAMYGPVAGVVQLKPFIPTFRADRPFMFAIRDTRTGVILFLGRVSNPMQ